MLLFNRYEIHPLPVLKFAAIAMVVIFVAIFALSLLGSLNSARSKPSTSLYGAPSMGGIFDAGGGMMEGGYAQSDSTMMPGAYRPSPSTPPPGTKAELYEVSDYRASIEKREKASACAAIAGLKPLSYVIFNSAIERSASCDYTFKVEKSHTEEVLAVIRGLAPKDLSEDTRTIQSQIDAISNQAETLAKQLAAIDDSLEQVTSDFDSVSTLARKQGDADALSRAIKYKLDLIKQLSQERQYVSTSLDQLARAKADSLDRLSYSFFSVSVYENRFVDWKAIGDSWKREAQRMIARINASLQHASTGVVSFLFWLAPLLLYALILFFLVKYGIRIGKYLWRV